MNKIIYYFPTKKGAPSKVGREIFQNLPSEFKHKYLFIFPQNVNDTKYWDDAISKYQHITLKELFYLSKEDIVHITVDPHVFPNRKFLLYLFAIIKRTKLIINYHGDPREEFKIQFKNKNYGCLTNVLTVIFESIILKSSYIVILNSNVMKQIFLKKSASSNFCVIPNGIESSWFEKTKTLKPPFVNSDKISILYHGRLAPEKGVDLLLDALSVIHKKYESDFMLYIVGSGPEKNKLKELCVESGLENNVSFLDNISDEELMAYLDTVDAAIYPSYYEPFSLAILEAFSRVNGPVLFSKNTGIYDFVKEDNYSFYTFKPVISDLVELLENLFNKELDGNISYGQKEFAQKYTWDRVAKQYKGVYESILS
jgi:glycosyltransferase involved in cell wall biosynthesis